jgi:acetyltransferase-like isoleucine patch superfamily enzyme
MQEQPSDVRVSSSRWGRRETFFGGFANRILQSFARTAPGAKTLRVKLHRWRGVKIGKDCWIGYDAILETAYPFLITLGDRVTLGIRVIIVAHFGQTTGVTIGNDVFIGPGVIILPGVTIGDGSVITAGTVVHRSVPPQTMVRGNPGECIAKVSVPMSHLISMEEFSRGLRPIRKDAPFKKSML